MSFDAEKQLDTIVYIAKRYYIDGCAQLDIARELDISRPTVSRLIKKAQEIGIVTIRINDTSYRLLQQADQLEKKFGLHQVIVVKNDGLNDDTTISLVASATAEYLCSVVKDGQLICMSQGTTTFRTLNYLHPVVNYSVNAVQVTGDSTLDLPYLKDSYITQELARNFGGTAYVMQCPLLVRSRVLRDLLMEEIYIEKHFHMFKQIDIAIVGIGSIDLLYENIFDDERERHKAVEQLLLKNAVGNICSNYFDKDGLSVPFDYGHFIGISLAQLKAIPEVIGVAVGIHKKEAIAGALNLGVINTLITDEKVASYLLNT